MPLLEDCQHQCLLSEGDDVPAHVNNGIKMALVIRTPWCKLLR